MTDMETDRTRMLARVHSYVEQGERLGTMDCVRLFELPDLDQFARLARIPRERRFGRDAHYVADTVELVNSDVDPALGEAGNRVAIAANLEEATLEILERAPASRWDCAVVSLPALATLGDPATDDRWTRLVRIAGARPLIAMEIEGVSAGTTRNGEEWASNQRRVLAIHRMLHQRNILSIASVILKTDDDPVEYEATLEAIRDLQDETDGFIGAQVMPVIDPDADAYYRSAPSAVQLLRMTAIARLFLDNIPHILIPANIAGLEMASVALSYGADVVDRIVQRHGVFSPKKPEAPATADMPIAGLQVFVGPTGVSSEAVRTRMVESHWHEKAVGPLLTKARPVHLGVQGA